MKQVLKVAIVFLCVLFTVQDKSYAQSDETVREYIERYKNVAMSEQKRAGIPAAIKLAQGIHESGAGLSALAVNANNHFGIKCKKDWTGQVYAHSDDSKDECFRKYYMDFESYQDHSDYLKSNARYGFLFSLPVTDYVGWAKGLKQAGYATNPKYAMLITTLVEKYNLQQYTEEAAGKIVVGKKPAGIQKTESTEPVKKSSGMVVTNDITPKEKIADATEAVMYKDGEPTDAVVKINGLRAVYGKKGDMPLQYAVKYDVRYQKLLSYNDMEEEPLPVDMPIYLERKNFLGKRSIHMVKEGENMFIVSQKEGIQLKYLRYLNDIADNEEPVVGAVLELQSMAEKKPPVIKVAPDIPEPEPVNVVKNQPKSESGYIYKEDAEQTDNTVTEEVVAIVDNSTADEQSDITTYGDEDVKEEVANTTTAVEEPKKTIEEEVPVTEQEEEVMEQVEDIKEAVQEPEEPKSELDLLKDQFDKLIYTDEKTADNPIQDGPKQIEEEEQEEVIDTEPTQVIDVADKDPANYYTVKKGDTAFSIAKKHGISIRQLMEWNDLDFDAIQAGQELRIKAY